MDKSDYWRKKLGETKGHVVDGKKEFRISATHKRNIVIQDLEWCNPNMCSQWNSTYGILPNSKFISGFACT